MEICPFTTFEISKVKKETKLVVEYNNLFRSDD